MLDLTTYLLSLADVCLNRQSAFIMGTNSPLLPDLFLYSYEADFKQELLKKNENNPFIPFNFTFCYIEDVISLNKL